MIRLLFGLLFIVFLNPAIASAQNLMVDLAQDSIDITAGFDGAQLSLFGVKEKDGQVAVVIRGPKKDMVVHKKNAVMGAWMNSESVRYKDVPEFYDFALSDDEDNILNAELRQKLGIGFDALKFVHDNARLSTNAQKEYRQALIRNRQAEKLFPVVPKDIVFLNNNFFKTEFFMPSNVPVGDYVIETFLINDMTVIDKHETRVKVAQIGFSAGVYNFAHSQSLAYAIIIILIAVGAGWLSNAVRRNNK